MRIVCISDTHGLHGKLTLPKGDVLIHSGDCTNLGSVPEVTNFGFWFRSLPFAHKILVPGNHDALFEWNERLARELIEDANTHVLIDEDLRIETPERGLDVFGSPWTSPFGRWNFMATDENRKRFWQAHSHLDHYDIVVTHGPCRSIHDSPEPGVKTGCEFQKRAIQKMKPLYHVCGHIHEGYGTKKIGATTYVNAAIWNHGENKLNAPIVFDL
ncbi:MPP_239FB domain containing protein [uncultured Caudovirales phage]|uniref:MPP_239FB domain containing protein n=1 Tax=uncultured Caudovirales phage TaxID=2100421 RepID=A0A6J5L154_9CAUD|nr:MPP_239FB domain containing protein [uncultured Caudovirales phage]